MYSFRPFRAEDLWGMSLQPEQAWVKTAFGTLDQARMLETSYSETLLRDGIPVALAGAVPMAVNICRIWAYFRIDIAPGEMFSAVRWGRVFLEGLPFRRVETTVACDFLPGHRLVRMLGFGKPEATRLRLYGYEGQDEALYARVKVDGRWQPSSP
jgi:hypothetical protein